MAETGDNRNYVSGNGNGNGNGKRDRWHVGKEIPITLVVVLVIQAGALMWSLGRLSEKLDTAVAQVQVMQAERFTREDARKEALIISEQHKAIDLSVNLLRDRVTNIEQQQALVLQKALQDSLRIRGK